MGMTLHCPNCHEDLGKVTENENEVYCSNCTEEFVNTDKKDYYPIQWKEDKNLKNGQRI